MSNWNSEQFFFIIPQATGSQLGLLVAAVVTTISAFIVAFSATWRISLVTIAFLPLLMISGLSFNAFLGGGGQNTALSAGQVRYF